MGIAATATARDERRSAPGLRLSAMLLGIALYGTVVVYLSARLARHFELVAIVLQLGLLAPAVWIGWKGPVNEWQRSRLPFAPGERWVIASILLFLAAAATISGVWGGITISDESSYRFEARILATGHLFAPSPPRPATAGVQTPAPFHFEHDIVSGRGWYSKYPLGWPLLLALAGKIKASWLINPLLAAGILFFAASIAKTAYHPTTGVFAVWLLALSPFFLEVSVGSLSHPFAGFITAAATLLCFKGSESRSLACFSAMYVLLIAGFYVRIYSTFLIAAVLSIYALAAARCNRAFFIRVLGTEIVAACAGIASFLLYNLVCTGRFASTPYGEYRGLMIPREVTASLPEILSGLTWTWKKSAESTLLFSFPLIFPLAAIGFWASRKKAPISWLLLALFPALALGYLVQKDSSGSIVAERYWFEAFFGIAILAAEGLRSIISAWKPGRWPLLSAAIGLAIVQIGLSGVACSWWAARGARFTAVQRTAEGVRCDRCVVFLADSPGHFVGSRLNLNGPGWRTASAFYAVDPGPAQRDYWTRALERNRWVAVTYDPAGHSGTIIGRGEVGF